MRVDARDVLDPNAKTVRPFRAQIVGHFRRVGPNAWDDYKLVHRDEGAFVVNPELHVQIESHGVDLRIRKDGRVVRVRWLPDASDASQIERATPDEKRAFFGERYLEIFESAKGAGAAAVIASKFRG